jgi:hypothetical protein
LASPQPTKIEKRDTLEHLAEYVAAFHPRLIGLTGAPDQIRKVATAYKACSSEGHEIPSAGNRGRIPCYRAVLEAGRAEVSAAEQAAMVPSADTPSPGTDFTSIWRTRSRTRFETTAKLFPVSRSRWLAAHWSLEYCRFAGIFENSHDGPQFELVINIART